MPESVEVLRSRMDEEEVGLVEPESALVYPSEFSQLWKYSCCRAFSAVIRSEPSNLSMTCVDNVIQLTMVQS